MAIGQARAAQALRDDLLAVLFPHGDLPPTEFLQTQVKLKLLALVNGIESRLNGNRTEKEQQSWEMLSRAGFLREPALVHFALARLAEERIADHMVHAGVSPLAQLPAELLGHENGRLAELAKQLLQAERWSADSDLYRRLDSEVLHQLCWRIVAVRQRQDPAISDEVLAAARELLAAQAKDVALVARKLVFFLGPEHRQALDDPGRAGLHLFVAALSQENGVNPDLLYRMIDDTSVAPLLLLLRARGIPAWGVPSIAKTLRGADRSQFDDRVYDQIDPIQARIAVAEWETA